MRLLAIFHSFYFSDLNHPCLKRHILNERMTTGFMKSLVVPCHIMWYRITSNFCRVKFLCFCIKTTTFIFCWFFFYRLKILLPKNFVTGSNKLFLQHITFCYFNFGSPELSAEYYRNYRLYSTCHIGRWFSWLRFMAFNATYNNISVISLWV